MLLFRETASTSVQPDRPGRAHRSISPALLRCPANYRCRPDREADPILIPAHACPMQCCRLLPIELVISGCGSGRDFPASARVGENRSRIESLLKAFATCARKEPACVVLRKPSSIARGPVRLDVGADDDLVPLLDIPGIRSVSQLLRCVGRELLLTTPPRCPARVAVANDIQVLLRASRSGLEVAKKQPSGYT